MVQSSYPTFSIISSPLVRSHFTLFTLRYGRQRAFGGLADPNGSKCILSVTKPPIRVIRNSAPSILIIPSRLEKSHTLNDTVWTHPGSLGTRFDTRFEGGRNRSSRLRFQWYKISS